ncbi:MAG: YscO family type III secretion system apparatus protein [Desulfovibrionaceae bacterium]|jgi:flagellar biosynthesis chaperone FliJ|nr:YscO family type III secretion system apparatus protein [Desulfovibrionaceae bacterium]
MSADYALKDLLRVRNFRETTAANEVAACRRRLEEAERAIAARTRELAEYHGWRVNREGELFDGITGRMVHLNDLDDLKQKIALLREREAEHEQRVLDAESERDKRQGEVATAQERHRTAARDKAKIEEHRKIWLEEERKAAEFAADKELEDFRAPDRDALEEEEDAEDQ